MAESDKEQIEKQVTLGSQLSEIGKVANWTQLLASQHAIPANVHFAIDLCLEEAISNIISHGYGGGAGHSVTVSFTMPRQGQYVFVVEDDAPPFNPLEAPELPPLNPGEEIRVGGLGLRLLRQFAETLEYEPRQPGNRLRMSFSTAGSVVQAQ